MAGGGGFLGPKAIANRQKSKGLQKLRWYCEMCQKQCRDDNGFKCHVQSESHQRQMMLFSQNTSAFLNQFSQDFLTDFMDVLKRRFGTKRTAANKVYNEYISHKTHRHLNSTKWSGLTDFITYLGREGMAKVDETEKGWFITYIDRDPAVIARQEELKRRKRCELDETERAQRQLEAQIQSAREQMNSRGAVQEVQATELERNGNDAPITLSLTTVSPHVNVASSTVGTSVRQGNVLASEASTSTAVRSKQGVGEKRKKSALDDILETEKRHIVKKQKDTRRRDNWIMKGIVVKVMNKDLKGGKFYRKKGVIRAVEENYIAHLSMLDSATVLKIDQSDLETVLPAVGGHVLILNGKHCGERGVLEAIDVEGFCASIRLNSSGIIADGIEYEDVSKFIGVE